MDCNIFSDSGQARGLDRRAASGTGRWRRRSTKARTEEEAEEEQEEEDEEPNPPAKKAPAKRAPAKRASASVGGRQALPEPPQQPKGVQMVFVPGDGSDMGYEETVEVDDDEDGFGPDQ